MLPRLEELWAAHLPPELNRHRKGRRGHTRLLVRDLWREMDGGREWQFNNHYAIVCMTRSAFRAISLTAFWAVFQAEDAIQLGILDVYMQPFNLWVAEEKLSWVVGTTTHSVL